MQWAIWLLLAVSLCLTQEKKLAPQKQTKYLQVAMELRGGLDFPEWIRLGKLALTVVPGSVEAECLFSDMSFIKTSLPNQPWYTVSGPNAWPYKEIVARWV